MQLKKQIYFTSFLIFIFFFFLNIGHYAYINFNFGSDGFHYYSMMRNIAFHQSFYEGPVFEYFLGNHAYLILIAFAPLVYIFESPLILLFLNLASIFISSFLLYAINLKIFKGLKESNSLSIFGSLSFLLHPIVFRNYFAGAYLFQPDILLCSGLLLMFYGFIYEKRYIFFFSIIFILFIKEEYVALFPFFYILCVVLTRILELENKIILSRLCIFQTCLIYFACSIISVLTLFYFRELNALNFVYQHQVISFENIQNFSIVDFFYTFFKFVIPYIPIIIGNFFFFKVYKSKFQALKFTKVLSIVCLVIGLKMTENIFVYSNLDGTPWGNLMMVPAIFLCLSAMIKILIDDTNTSFIYTFIAPVFFSIILIYSIYLPRYLTTRLTIEWITGVNSGHIQRSAIEIKRTLDSVTNNMIAEDKQYFILPEHFLYPFMNKSHASTRFININGVDKVNFVNNANAIVFRKTDNYEHLYKPFLTEFKVALETKNFRVYVTKEPR